MILFRSKEYDILMGIEIDGINWEVRRRKDDAVYATSCGREICIIELMQISKDAGYTAIQFITTQIRGGVRLFLNKEHTSYCDCRYIGWLEEGYTPDIKVVITK